MAGTTPTTIQPPHRVDNNGIAPSPAAIQTWLKEWWDWFNTSGNMKPEYKTEWDFFVDSLPPADLKAFLEDAYLNAGSATGDADACFY